MKVSILFSSSTEASETGAAAEEPTGGVERDEVDVDETS
jgi:hypothetical protein